MYQLLDFDEQNLLIDCLRKAFHIGCVHVFLMSFCAMQICTFAFVHAHFGWLKKSYFFQFVSVLIWDSE